MTSSTHRYVERPTMGLRYLADFMAASKRGERSILQTSKYRPLVRAIQHTEARSTVSKFIRDGDKDTGWLVEEACRLRDRLVDDDFERDLLDNNADYIARFAEIAGHLDLPKASLLVPGPVGRVDIHGVTVLVGLHLRLARTTKTNKMKEGGAMLRYAKNKKLPPEIGAWQSAFIYGYLRDAAIDQSVEAERGLCLTIDAQSGICHSAPGNAVSRYANMKAACHSIAEQWPNIEAPRGAIF
jgi:hypothetical protein